MQYRQVIIAGCLLVSAILPPAATFVACVAAEPRRPGAAAEATALDADGAEQRVLVFVKEHQPELADVLEHLKEHRPTEHAQAVAELSRAVAKLAATKDERLRDLELKAWQARTRVDLLVARWMAAGKRERVVIETKLQAAIAGELEVRAAQLAYRKQRSAAWYDRQIERLREKGDELVATRLKSLLANEGHKPEAGPREPR